MSTDKIDKLKMLDAVYIYIQWAHVKYYIYVYINIYRKNILRHVQFKNQLSSFYELHQRGERKTSYAIQCQVSEKASSKNFSVSHQNSTNVDV